MIQRIQTLFLAIVVTAGILMFFFPLANYYNELTGNYKLYITGLKCMDPDPAVTTSFWFTLPSTVLTAASVLLALITIFLYKNRNIQIRIIAVNLLVTALNVILIFLYYTGKIESLTSIRSAYQFGIFLPLIALVFLILANRSIRKDEELVKSTDRIR